MLFLCWKVGKRTLRCQRTVEALKRVYCPRCLSVLSGIKIMAFLHERNSSNESPYGFRKGGGFAAVLLSGKDKKLHLHTAVVLSDRTLTWRKRSIILNINCYCSGKLQQHGIREPSALAESGTIFHNEPKTLSWKSLFTTCLKPPGETLWKLSLFFLYLY